MRNVLKSKPADPVSAWQEANDNMSDRSLAKLVGCASTTISRAKITGRLREGTMLEVERITGVPPIKWAEYREKLRQWNAQKKGRGR